jgi:hypothetical protein
MKKGLVVSIVITLFSLFLASAVSSATLLDSNEIGFNGQTRSNNYDALMDAYFSNGNVVSTINGNELWVPWFKTSSGSQVTDLQSGGNCNSGQTIDFTHNCMVTDEFSQMGILISMGKDQTRMTQFYNTVIASKSNYGNIPAWRIYRNGNTIEACRSGINGNCDTASDGTARIIIALFTASKNSNFADAMQKANYASLAKKIADDMLTYEVDNTCRQTSYGNVCHWLAGGSNVKTGGIASSDYAYTGYYPDAIIAMLTAYANTNDVKYYNAAKDFTLNYMQAANFNNNVFTVPPGKSFKWTVDSNGIMRASCTNTCSPVMWDGFDASRALGMCQANYYAKQMNIQLPYLQKYCDLLSAKYMGNAASAPIQFYPDGSAAAAQSGYFAQGLESLHQAGGNSALFKATVDNALSHFSSSSKTFDNAASIGVYTTAFSVRALGMGIGRDANAFSTSGTVLPPTQTNTTNTTTNTTTATPPATSYATAGITSLASSCIYGSANTAGAVKSDVTSGACRTVIFGTASGDVKIFACTKTGGYVEIYKQASPSGVNYKACLANGCITQDNGFARFIPVTSTTTTTTQPPTTTPPPTTTTTSPKYTGISSLSTSCTYNSVKSTIKSDVTSGTCRTVVYGTPNGDVKIMGCEKSANTVEVYRQSSPAGLNFKACLGAGCVDNSCGFAKIAV